MKKTLAGIGIIFSVIAFQRANATILILRDASTLSRGLLPCERLDPNCGAFTGVNQSTTNLQLLQNNTNYATSQSTQNLFIQLNSTAVQLSNYITSDLTFASTTSIRIDKLTTTDSTTSVRIDQHQVALSTTAVRIDQHQVALSTIAQYLTGGAVAIYSAGTFKGNATALNFTDAISATCAGSTCTPTATASGGGGGAVGQTTMTYKLTQTGNIYLSTYPTSNGAYWYNAVSTITITNVRAIQLVTSTYTTCSSTYSIQTTTGSVSGQRILWTSVDSSSWSMKYSESKSESHAPSLQSVINAGTWLFMAQWSNPTLCGGEYPGGVWGLEYDYWYAPRP
jgi:hypothetical protein